MRGPRVRPSGPALAASVVLALEGLALAVIGAMELIALGSGQTTSTMSGIGLIGLTLVGAAALLAFAFGTLRRASWARSGGVVIQALALALALASLTVEPKVWTFTLILGGAGLAGLILLIAATRRDGAADPRLHGEASDNADPAAASDADRGDAS